MLKYRILASVCAIALVAVSCSDNGDAPNRPDGGGTTPTLSLNDPSSASEGGNATFAATLNKTSTTDVTVQYTVINLSTEDNDFSGSLSGTATIAAGATTTNIVIPVSDDSAAEGTELFHVTLSAPSNATLSKSVGASTIAANDGGVDISFSGQLAPLFLAKGCAGCHGGNGGFSVGTVASILTSGMHAPNVIKGLGGQSNLYLKTTDNPSFGARMPQGGPYLTTDEQNLIRDWINQGAQDN